jgi:chromosome transmission fidelity protein 1
MAAVSAVQAAFAFLRSLTAADVDGRVVTERSGSSGRAEAPAAPREDAHSAGGNASAGAPAAAAAAAQLPPHYKFVMLNPAVHFRPIVDAARSVILAGGTMQPIDDVVMQLFGHLPPRRLRVFSCGHMIPPENLSALAVARGPTGVAFDFRFQARRSAAVMDELGRALVSLAAVVPAGLVVFLPSYDYERDLVAHWGKSTAHAPTGGAGPAARAFAASVAGSGSSGGATSAADSAANGGSNVVAPPGSVLAALARRKRLFREPRASADMDRVLRDYAAAATGTAAAAGGEAASSSSGGCSGGGTTGALLFSVVGGKMSEGINFSDDLARCVVVVGLPFPNPSDPELTERMAYIDRLQAQGQQRTKLQQAQAQSLAAGSGSTPGRPGVAAAASSSAGSAPSAAGPAVTAGKAYYENLCMRAVNQSIGRSIRHVGDHATIVLLDQRYGTPRIASKLPRWIGKQLSTHAQWGSVVTTIGAFFRHKREAAAAAAAGRRNE